MAMGMPMPAKRPKKFSLGKTVAAAALLALFLVSAPVIFAFVSAFFMWDRNCTESSQAVALARSLSQDQLANLNARMVELEAQYPYEVLTDDSAPFIPDDLKYLKARYISLRYGGYIVLAKCNVSVGVNLNFDPSVTGQDMIELNWHAPTDENPYWRGSEILWTAPD